MTKAEDWEETLDELERRRQHAHAMGGPERLAKHHGKGKLDARARLDRLLDKGTFREFGTLVGGETGADGIVAGSGRAHGHPVIGGGGRRQDDGTPRGAGAEDLATLAGRTAPGGNAMRYRLLDRALPEQNAF